MMKNERKPFSWRVKCFDCNAQAIEDYDILKYREDEIKKMKKKCATKAEFAEKLRSKMQCLYWSKAEWELIIRLEDDGRVILLPWCGARDPESIAIDVTEDATFDWKSFAEYHIKRQIFKNEAKIDVFSQLCAKWDDFVTYCWEYRHKYQRIKKMEDNL